MIKLIGEGSRSLEPRYDSRKSFYNKAHVVDDSDGSQILYSYDTPVCKINSRGEVELLAQWDSSQTTLRHVKEFLQQNGFKVGSKSQIASMYGKKVERFSRKRGRVVRESKHTRIIERQLNEGPGAGYTVKTFGINNVKINSIKYVRDFENGSIYSIDGTATIDGIQADSYYYGTGLIDKEIPVYLSYVWISNYDINDIDYTEDDEQMKLALMELATDCIYDHADTEFVYGGGYSHSKYDGQVGEVDKTADYWQGYIEDDDIINYVDLAVRGGNKYEYYQVVLDGYDAYDAYDTEKEAIKIANELGQSGEYDLVTVDKVTEYIDYNGESIDDYTEQVYEYMEEI